MKIIVILILFTVSRVALGDSGVDRYGVLPQIQQMSVSPNGENVAFRTVSLKHDLISIVKFNPTKKVGSINVSSVKPNNIRFIDNNNLLLNVSAETRAKGFRGEFEVSIAMAYNIKKNQKQRTGIPLFLAK